jgi:tRNA dimethylallyltransferase
MINYKGPIIVIAGLTGSGKSSLATEVAKKINGYIINGDSRQVYKELKIGTAQPTPEIIEDNTWYIDGIKHHLYGHVSAKNSYDLYQYQKDVQKILNKESQIPILVGGTGLYIDSIIHNYNLKESNTDSRLKLESLSLPELQDLIDKEDLKKMNNSDRNNPIRLIRVIEKGGINKQTGEQLNYLYLQLDIDQELLKERVIKRVDQMFEDGLLEENKQLLEIGLTYNNRALQSIGYKEFEDFFNKKISIEEVKNNIILHTLQYSKRQRTWFKRNKESVKIKNSTEAYEFISNFLTIS